MNTRRSSISKFGPNPELIAIYVVRAMSKRQGEQQRYSANELSFELGVRRDDIDDALVKLDAQDIIDMKRMSLTLNGFALGMAIGSKRLKPLRRPMTEQRQAA